MTTAPTYITNAEIARHFGVRPTAVANWRVRYPVEHEVFPTPEPDAWFRSGRDMLPLWLEHRMPEWDAWLARKRAAHAWRPSRAWKAAS
jgi:hypothetical protein